MNPRNESSPQPVEVAIEKMVYGGEGLARTPEGVLLVRDVLAGERALVLPEPARRGVRRATLVQLIEPSPSRTPAACPHYDHCGGCQYQHIAYPAQLEMKQQILAECLQRIGKVALEVPIQAIPSHPWHYRNRIRLRAEKSPAGFRIGYLGKASHTLTAVDCCPIAMPAIESVIKKLASGEMAELFPEGTAELELFSDESGRTLLATVYSPLPAPQSFGEAWREALPQFESVCWSQSATRQGSRAKDTVWGNGAVVYRVGEFHYRISHHSFFQANGGMLQPMLAAAVGELSGTRALDLYAGAGFFTLPLSRRFERVAAVEAHPAAARDLAANAGAAGMRVQTHHKSVERFLEATSRNWDLILVDPPRAGLGKPVLEDLRRLAPPRLVYVSCDPTTLARDLQFLLAAGYAIEAITLADQFPQTFHIETIVRLTRRRESRVQSSAK